METKHFWVVLLGDGSTEVIFTDKNGDIKKFESFHAAELAGAKAIDGIAWDYFFVLGPTWEEK